MPVAEGLLWLDKPVARQFLIGLPQAGDRLHFVVGGASSAGDGRRDEDRSHAREARRVLVCVSSLFC